MAQIPIAFCLVAAVFFPVNRHAFGKVAAKNNHIGPQIANQIGQKIARQHARRTPQCQGWKQQVILEPLLFDLTHKAVQAALKLFLGHGAVLIAAHFQVM